MSEQSEWEKIDDLIGKDPEWRRLRSDDPRARERESEIFDEWLAQHDAGLVEECVNVLEEAQEDQYVMGYHGFTPEQCKKWNEWVCRLADDVRALRPNADRELQRIKLRAGIEELEIAKRAVREGRFIRYIDKRIAVIKRDLSAIDSHSPIDT